MQILAQSETTITKTKEVVEETSSAIFDMNSLTTLAVFLAIAFVAGAVISFVLQQFQTFKPVQYAFWGIRAGVLALIVKALWSMFRQCPKTWLSYCIAAWAFIAAAFLPVNIIVVIISCALLGLFSYSIVNRRKPQ